MKQAYTIQVGWARRGRIDDAAEFLSVSSRHLLRLADLSKVKTIRIGRRRLVPDAEVRQLAIEGC